MDELIIDRARWDNASVTPEDSDTWLYGRNGMCCLGFCARQLAGAKVSDIQARLGHESLQTTGRYLAALGSAENAHAEALAELFGIEE